MEVFQLFIQDSVQWHAIPYLHLGQIAEYFFLRFDVYFFWEVPTLFYQWTTYMFKQFFYFSMKNKRYIYIYTNYKNTTFVLQSLVLSHENCIQA